MSEPNEAVAKKIEDMRAKEEAEKRIEADKQMEINKTRFNVGTQNNGYTVTGVDLSDNADKEMAIQELITAQQKLALDYKDAAKADINYREIGEPGSREREAYLASKLSSHNDAYTMSMLTSCYAPLAEGVNVKSLAACFFTHKMVDIMNPEFKTDQARMFSNMASSMKTALSGHPVLKFMSKNFVDELGEAGSQGMSDSLSKHLEANTLDDIVMTPRQIAALKLNFMEQYYVDTRSIDPSSADYADQMEAMTADYDKAIAHLGAIANNSGYDMSAIADEERYLVGLKAKQDPNKRYESMFVEAEPPYGAQPVQNGEVWQGDYATADGHAWTSEGSSGAFTVRERYTTDMLPQLRDDLARKGQQYAWMQQYLESDACPASKDAKAQAKAVIEQQFSEYREFVSVQLQDDLGFSDSYAKQVFDESFGRAESNEKKISKAHVFDQADVFSSHSKADPGMDFYRELRYVSEKEALKERIGQDFSAGRTENPTPRQATEEIANGKGFASKTDLDLRREMLLKLDSSGTDVDEIGRRLTNSYIKGMDGNELAQHMLHIGCNMEQGWQHNLTMVNGEVQSTYSRHLEPSSFEGSEFAVQRRIAQSEPAISDAVDSPASQSSRPVYDDVVFDDSPDSGGFDI